MTILRTHHHDGTVGTSATAAGEGYDILTGTAGVYVAGGVINQALRWTTGAAAAYFGDNLAGGYCTFYVRFPAALPTAEMVIASATDASAVGLGALSVDTTGKVKMYSGAAATLVATGTTVLSVNTWYRIEWHCDGGSQEVKLFTQTGTTTLDDLTGAAAAGTSGKQRFGQPINGKKGNTGDEVDLDEVQIGNAWIDLAAPPPVASFTHSESVLTTSVNGTASSATSPATITGYDWNWGDSSTHGTGSTSSHTYSAAGTYTVTLTVTDSNSNTGTASASVNVAPAAGTVTVQSVDVSTGWTPSSGTVLSCITDGDPTTLVTSSAPPTAQEFDFTLQAVTPPSTGQPFKIFLTIDAPLSTAASINAQFGETISGSFTQRSALTSVTVASGSGSSVTNVVALNFPWTDVQNMTTGGWNAPRLKLQATAS